MNRRCPRLHSNTSMNDDAIIALGLTFMSMVLMGVDGDKGHKQVTFYVCFISNMK